MSLIKYILPNLPSFDIILINLPSEDYVEEYSYHRSVPPIGLGIIATFLKNEGINVGLLDAEFYHLQFSDIVGIIKTANPKFIGINCYSPGVGYCKQLIDYLKDESQIIIGGPHINIGGYDDFKEFDDVFFVSGYGEIPTLNIIKGNEQRKIIINNAIDKAIVDLVLDYSFFPNSIIINENKQKEAVVITTRGCFNKCTYCLSSSLKYRRRSLDSVMTELKLLLRNAEIIHFLDDIVFPSDNYLKRFINNLPEYGIKNFMWRGLISIEILKKIDIGLLKRTGCQSLSIGIESGSERIIRLLGKNYTIDEIFKVFGNLELYGIQCKIFFMIGVPTEDFESYNDTAHLIKSLKQFSIVTEINIFQYKPYPGTFLYQEYFNNVSLSYFFTDLRKKYKGRIKNIQMEKALAKDTYFCEHPHLFCPVSELQDLLVDLYDLFY